jgi:hypothetical protein
VDLTVVIGTATAVLALTLQILTWRLSRTDRLLQRISEQLSAIYAIAVAMRDRSEPPNQS